MKYCVIGKSLPHTLSPQIHTALGNRAYAVTELADGDAVGAFVRSGEYDGYNVTIPYKETVIPYLDYVHPSALAVGAVNTVVRDSKGRLCGYNTDVYGMTCALKCANIRLKGRKVLILGSGGTCKTAIQVCADLHADRVSVVSRAGQLNYDNCYDLTDTEVIINTTPVGMMPHAYEMPIELNRFRNLKGVYDCVYNPLETMLVKEAKAMGIPSANGLKMLVEQAAEAHNIFAEHSYGELHRVEERKSQSVYTSILRDRRNIVLVGMAGSGKTTIGEILAQRLGREFLDTDEMVEREQGRSIPDIFATDGEAAFREAESQAVEQACQKLGCVIATGGGAVLKDKNRFFMQSNGTVVLVLRELDNLATEGRPLSSDIQKAKALFEKRREIYYNCAEIVVDNNSSAEDAADKILIQAGYTALGE